MVPQGQSNTSVTLTGSKVELKGADRESVKGNGSECHLFLFL